MLVGLRRSLASSCDVHLERAGRSGQVSLIVDGKPPKTIEALRGPRRTPRPSDQHQKPGVPPMRPICINGGATDAVES